MSVTIPEHALGYFRRTLARFMEMADREPALTEVLYDGGGRVVVDIGGVLHAVPDHGLDDDTVIALAGNSAVATDAVFNADRPFLSVMMDQYRVTFMRPPAVARPIMAMRRLMRTPVPLARYVSDGIMTAEQAEQLRGMVRDKLTIIVSGAVGSGKTTLVRALLDEIPREERIISLEDPRELALTTDDGAAPRAHWVALEAVPQVMELDALLRASLRLRPDRILVGEVRGPEALELVRAANVGHRGLIATVHSNGAEEAIERLYTLASEAQPHLRRESVERAIDVVVQIDGRGKDRKITEIWERGHAAD